MVLVMTMIFLSGLASETFKAKVKPAIPEPITRKSVCIKIKLKGDNGGS
jgi:hypothetical protein